MVSKKNSENKIYISGLRYIWITKKNICLFIIRKIVLLNQML